VINVAGAAAGVALAVATERLIGRAAPRQRTRLWAVALPGAAAIYPLARRTGHLRREGMIEIGALGAYSAFALRLPGGSKERALAAGWASHAAFDALHHRGDGSRIPSWYPAACAGYDLVVAGTLLRA
jgi:hypothetical protein